MLRNSTRGTAPARYTCTCPKRCATPSARWKNWLNSTLQPQMQQWRRPHAVCSSHCRWPSIQRSPSGRISQSSTATPPASHTVSWIWAPSSPPTPSARTIRRLSEPSSSLCRSSGRVSRPDERQRLDPAVVRAVLESLPFVWSRYAHSEYQTVLSLRFKAELNRIAPAGTPRHFIVNTGAEAVENAMKSVLMNRVMRSQDAAGGFIVSFEGAFHGRTLGCLAVTHRKKARLGFPTFDWPHIPFPVEEAGSPKETARREERSLKQLWDLLVSGRMPRAEKSKDTYRREMDAIDAFLGEIKGW